MRRTVHSSMMTAEMLMSVSKETSRPLSPFSYFLLRCAADLQKIGETGDVTQIHSRETPNASNALSLISQKNMMQSSSSSLVVMMMMMKKKKNQHIFAADAKLLLLLR